MGLNVSIIAGGKKKEGKRNAYDFYETPEWCTEALMEREKFEGEVWECASGNGKMSKVIKKTNPVYSSDIRYEVCGDGGVDFLMSSRKTDNIITNPPFNIGLEFIERAKQLASKKIAMLLRLQFLESSGRYDMWKDKDFPLKTVYVFCKRIGFSNQDRGGVLAFAWYVWEKGYTGNPTVDWIF